MPYDTFRGTYQINPAAPHNLASQNLCVSTTAPRIADTQRLAHRRRAAVSKKQYVHICSQHYCTSIRNYDKYMDMCMCFNHDSRRTLE